MSNDATPSAIALTTSSPGLTWVCVHAAGIDPYAAAVITTVGAAVGEPDEVATGLRVAFQQTGSRQLAVIGHRDDPIYATAAGLASPPGARSEAPTVPDGLEGGALATIRRTVGLLCNCWCVPRGTVVTGIAVEGDGSAEDVVLEIAKGGRPPEAEPAVTVRTAGGRRESLDSLATELDSLEPAAAILPPSAVDAPAAGHEPPAVEPSTASGEISSGAAPGGDEIVSGALDIGGEIATGPLGTGGGVRSGPVDIGGPAGVSGAISLGRRGSSGPLASTPPVESSTTSQHGAIRSDAVGQTGAIESDALSTALTAETDDAVGDDGDHYPSDLWLDPEPSAPPPSPTDSSDDGSIHERLENAADTLGEFLDLRCKRDSRRRDAVRMLKAGASPDPLLRALQVLVRENGNDLSAVRDAYGTLDMAQSLLSKEEMLAVLRRVFLS